MSQLEIVYVLSNPSMPGLIKIGRTSKDNANERIAQLYTTGVPVPFTLEFACKVTNAKEVEDALHLAFSPNRINSQREFFRMDSQQAIAILRLLHTEDATVEIEKQPADLDSQSIAAAEQLKKRRPNLDFVEMGIPIGSLLEFMSDGTTVCVVGPRKIKFGEEELYLTEVTRRLLQLEYSVSPGQYWKFNGRSIAEIYDETYLILD